MNTKCKFPFSYRGMTYNSCTMEGESRHWCSTKTDSNGDHVTGNWGYCNSLIVGLPSNYGEIEVNWKKKKLYLRLITPTISHKSNSNVAREHMIDWSNGSEEDVNCASGIDKRSC